LIWALESEDPSIFGNGHRIFPDGIVEIVFHYGDPFLTCTADSQAELQPRSFAISQTSKFIDIRATGSSGLISVRLFPWGAAAFLSVPVSEFADQQIPAAELWGNSARELEEQIQCAGSVEQRIRLVEDFLLAQLSRHYSQDDQAVMQLIRHFWARRGCVVVSEITREFGISERQLERKFQRVTGAAPKQIARLARFLHACHQLQTSNENLAKIALDCGYYDQAHFIREFKSFSGLTPTQLASNSEVSFLSLD